MDHICLSYEEMELLCEVPNASFRLYALLKQQKLWSYHRLARMFFRDGVRNKYIRRPSKTEIKKSLQRLWQVGLVEIARDGNHSRVIVRFPKGFSSATVITDIGSAWVDKGPWEPIVRPSVSPKIRARVFQRDGKVCAQCGTAADLTIDHIYPVSRGGTDDLGNLQVLCRSCNCRKHAKVPDVC